MSKVTLRDIAKELGISKGTVDRAIHNRPDVNAETRQKVLALIEKYNYKPNKAARSLSLKSRKNRIGVILQTSPRFFWDSVKNGIRTAESELGDFGIEIIYKELKESREPMEIIQKLEELVEEKAEAVILVPVSSPEVRSAVKKAAEMGIAVITLNDDIGDSGRTFYVGPQIRQSGRIAAELMGKFLNFRGRVITINGSIESFEYSERLEGFTELVKEKYPHITIAGNYTYSPDRKFENEKCPMMEMLKDNREIDGIYDVDGASLYNIGRAVKENCQGEKVVLIGHEISDEVRELLEDGTIYACISQDPYSQGYSSVKLTYSYLAEGKIPESERMFTRLDIILKENMLNRENIINPHYYR